MPTAPPALPLLPAAPPALLQCLAASGLQALAALLAATLPDSQALALPAAQCWLAVVALRAWHLRPSLPGRPAGSR